MDLVLPFSKLRKGNADIAGGKGASLGEMTNAGIPVPPGFVVLSTTFDKFIDATDLNVEIDAILDKVNHKEIHTVDKASEEIQGLILQAKMPEDIKIEIEKEFKVLGAEFVAVRSSATAEDGAEHAWAGQLDSFLNTTEKDLFEKIQRCWASLFTPRAIFYRFEKGLHGDKISVAVVVQKMVNSEKSGIAFSVHPVTQDRNQLIIEAGFGLGEAIVSGQITPDSYVVEKEPRQIIDTNVEVQKRGMFRKPEGGSEWRDLSDEDGSKQALSGKEIMEFAELILRIENHYGFPCDIEWAYEDGKFYIVQSRPITTLTDNTSVTETLTGFGLDAVNQYIRTKKRWYNKSYSGYLYCIAEQGLAISYGEAINDQTIPYGICFQNYTRKDHLDWFWDSDLLVEKRNQIIETVKSDKTYVNKFYDTWKKEWDLFNEEWNKISFTNFHTLTIDEIRSKLLPLHLKYINHSKYAYIVDTFLNDSKKDWFEEMIKAELGEKATSEVIATLSSPVFESFVNEFEVKKLEIAKLIIDKESKEKILKACKELEDEFFWIRVNYKAYKRLNAEEILKEAKDEAEKYRSGILEKIKLENSRILENKKKKEDLIAELKISQELINIIAVSETFTHIQDKRKEGVLKSNLLFYEGLEASAQKLSKDKDLLFYITPTEFLYKENFDVINWTEIQDRIDNGVLMIYCEGKINILTRSQFEKDIPINTFFPEFSNIKEIHGSVAYKGIVQGIAKVVRSVSEINNFNDGEVLIANQTTPEFVPAMKKAIAFVTDQGGITCHAAIIAREMKKPCIIGTKDASKIIKDGDEVLVDADNGVIKIIKTGSSNSQDKDIFISPELKNFKPSEYDYYGFWKQDLFPGCFWSNCWVPELATKLQIQTDGVYAITMFGGQYFIKHTQREHISAQIKQRIQSHDLAFFENIKNASEEAFKIGAKEGEMLRDAKPTLENFRKFFYNAQKINYLWLLGASHFNEAAEQMIQETVVAEHFPAEHILDIIPPLVTPLLDRHKELVILKKEVGTKTLEEIKNDKKLFAKFEEQVEKYPWIEIFNFVGDRLTVERLYEQVAHIEVEHPKKNTFSISEELKWRAHCINVCGYVKQAGAEYFSIFSEFVLPFLKNIAKEIGLSYQEFMAVTTTEVEAVLDGTLSSAELKERAQKRIGIYDCAFIAIENGVTLFIEEPNDIAILKKMIPVADKNSDEIRGDIGNPGKYTGPVRIIMNTADFGKMKTGDVLVSTMTTPDFVILMQKSGAIVTDIGGLLCHAAIVSREINRPCIIGTKFATQILHDDDIVEVDANIGVVKIVKKNFNLAHAPNVIGGKEWFLTITRNMSFWHQCASNDGNAKYLSDWGINASYRILLLSINATQTLIFANKQNLDQFIVGLRNATDTLEKMKILEDKYHLFADELLSSLKGIQKNLTSETFKKFITSYSRFTAGLNITAFLGRSYTEALTKYLEEKGIAKEEISHILGTITYPSTKTPFFKSEIALLELAAKIKEKKIKKNEIAVEVKIWLDNHGYIPVNFNEEPYTEEFVQEKLKEFLHIDCHAKIKELESAHDANIKAASDKIAELNDSEITRMAITLQETTSLNEFRKNVFSKVSLEYRPVFAEIAKRAGSSNWRDCFFLTHDEMGDIVAGKKLDILELKKIRDVAGAYADDNDNLVYLTHEEARQLNEFISHKKPEEIKKDSVIKGMSACKGVVTGTAKIVLSREDFHKMKKGDILVAPMTSVDYVPIMEMASAFVTNEGGITSHASIVAREMKKPCILGTQNATQILKDGDIVEVDADNGVVRILKSTGIDPNKQLLIMRDRKLTLSPVYWNQLLQVSDNVRKLYGDVLDTQYMFFTGGRAYIVPIKEQWDRVGNFIADKLLSEKSYFEQIINEAVITKKMILDFLKDNKKDYSSFSFEQLIAKTKEIENLYYKYDVATVFAWFVAGDILRTKLREKLRLTETEFDAISLPEEKTYASQMDKKILHAALENNDNENAKKLSNEFYWILFGYDGPTIADEKYFLEQIKSHKNNAKKELQILEDREEKVEEEKKIVLSKHHFTSEQERLLDIFRIITIWTDERKMLDFQLFYHYGKVLDVFSKQTGVTVEQLKYLFTFELVELQTKSKELAHIANDRMHNEFVTISDRNGIRIANLEEFSVFKKLFMNETNKTEIKGKVASTGPLKIYQGKVKVLMSSSECDKVLDGEIMVATMTTPDYVPAMKKALGFITDEGGVTCHAAIIGREMNKPCIIGTKVATKNLKDGDIVEVDTDNGIVRIIK